MWPLPRLQRLDQPVLLVAFLDKSIFLALIMATIAVITGVVTGTDGLSGSSRLTPGLRHYSALSR